MIESVSLQRLGRVAYSLALMQRVFLACLGAGFLVGFLAGGAAPPDLMLVGLVLLVLVAGLVMLVCTYRCASGSGRSGLFWVLMVIIFKWISLIILCYLTRKWLVARGVKVHSLGLGFTLPQEAPEEAPQVEDIGFSRF